MEGSTCVCSIVASPVQFQPAVGAGGVNPDQLDQTAQPDRKPQGVILVTEHNAEVNAGLQSCGAPIMLPRFGRKTGSASHSKLANLMSLSFVNTEKSWLQLIGRWSLQWFQMEEMTET